MRRLPRQKCVGLGFTFPSNQKKNTLNHDWVDEGNELLDQTTYQRHIKCLSAKQSMQSKLIVMKETVGSRRTWIQTERPSVSEVIKKFPCLVEYEVVGDSFSIIHKIQDKHSIIM